MYDSQFYETIRPWSYSSASRVVPLVLDLVRPASVVDIGCGDGTWLSVFMQHGVSDVVGVDGPYVRADQLQIPETHFRPFDLERFDLELGRKFELAISLEVGEHLSPAAAQKFVTGLTSLAPVVLFSAAVPLQGGTGHVNEQWPDYWAALFRDRAYQMVDAIRSAVWDDPDVTPFYAQNLMLYVASARLERDAALMRAAEANSRMPLRLVHPDIFHARVNEEHDACARATNPTIRQALRLLSRAASRSLRSRLGR